MRKKSPKPVPPNAQQGKQGDIKNVCTSLPALSQGWMRAGTLSLRRKGKRNVLVVVPHGYKNNDDNAEILGCHIAEMLDAYAIINNRLYRRPRTDGKGTLLEAPDPESFLIDLNDPEQAKKVSTYWNGLRGFVRSITKKLQEPAIVIFLHGMGDEYADEKRAGDVCVGRGFVGAYNDTKASASKAFLEKLTEELGKADLGAITFNVPRYSGESRLPSELRKDLRSSVEAVQVEFRCTGYRDSLENIRKTAIRFAEVIESLSTFKEMEEDVMPQKKDKSEPKGAGQEKAPEPITTEETTIQELPTVLPLEQLPSLTFEPEAEERFHRLIEDVSGWNEIQNDHKKTVAFTGDIKESFVKDVTQGFQFFKGLVNENYYQAGYFFSKVRERQKKHKLWNAYLRTIGFPRRTAHKYIQVYEGIGEDLGKYAYLGSSKLEIITRLKTDDVKPYLEENAQAVEQSTVEQLREEIKAKLQPKKPRKTASPEVIKRGNVKIQPGRTKRTIAITGLSKETFDSILEGIKNLFPEE